MSCFLAYSGGGPPGTGRLLVEFALLFAAEPELEEDVGSVLAGAELELDAAGVSELADGVLLAGVAGVAAAVDFVGVLAGVCLLVDLFAVAWWDLVWTTRL